MLSATQPVPVSALIAAKEAYAPKLTPIRQQYETEVTLAYKKKEERIEGSEKLRVEAQETKVTLSQESRKMWREYDQKVAETAHDRQVKHKKAEKTQIALEEYTKAQRDRNNNILSGNPNVPEGRSAPIALRRETQRKLDGAMQIEKEATLKLADERAKSNRKERLHEKQNQQPDTAVADKRYEELRKKLGKAYGVHVT